MGIATSAHIKWNSECAKAACYRAKESKANLIVATKADTTENDPGSNDHDEQTLLRHTPCPVLLARPTNRPLGSIVLATVDTQTMDDTHLALNNAILAAAFNMAEDTDSTVHLFCALDEKKPLRRTLDLNT